MSHKFSSLNQLASILITISGLVLAIVFIYIGYFNYPSDGDDFARAINDRAPFFLSMKKWYLYNNGRFINALLVDHSWLYGQVTYRYLSPVGIILWFIALVFFMVNYLKSHFEVINPSVLCLCVFSLATFFNASVPNIQEWFYWYASMSVYLLGSSFLLLMLGFLLAANRSNSSVYFYLASFFGFLMTGSHELLALVALCISLCFFVGRFLSNNNSINNFLPLLGSTIGTLLMVFSPGTGSRLSMVENNDSLWPVFSKLFSDFLTQSPIILLEGMIYWVSWSLLAFCLLGMLVGLLSSKVTDGKKLMFYMISSFSVLLTLTILPVMLSYKVNINGPTRLTNLAYFIFILVCFLNAMQLGSYLKKYFLFKNTQHIHNILLLAVMFIIYQAMQSTNVQYAYQDIVNNRLHRQQSDLNHWRYLIEQAKQTKPTELELPGLTRVDSTNVTRMAINSDANSRHNRAFARWQGLEKTNITRSRFDRIMREFIIDNHEKLQSANDTRLIRYNDEYRNYLLVQIKKTRNQKPEEICISDLSSSINITTYDDYKKIPFVWKAGKTCTRLFDRKIYCDDIDESWYCRIALPMDMTNQLKVEWLDVKWID